MSNKTKKLTVKYNIILKRVGLIDPHISADKAHEIMENSRYAETFYAMHLNDSARGVPGATAQMPDLPSSEVL